MVAFGTASQVASNNASFSLARPTSTASGDILVAFLVGDSGGLGITGGATWTVLASGAVSGNQAYLLAWKVAGGSEPANYTCSQTSGGDATAHVIRATNGATTTPVFAVDDSGQSGTSISTPSVTPDGSTDLLIRFAFGDPAESANSWTAPASHTERTDTSSSQFTSGSTATRQLASGGATGTASFTSAQSISNGGGITVAITDGASPQTITASGIASAEAFGTAKLNLFITPGGIASGEAFGDAVVTTPEEQFIGPTGIASGEAFGALTTVLYVGPSGIATGEALGSPNVVAVIGPTGIESEEAFGLTNVAIEQFIEPSGIVSKESFGTLNLQLGYPQTIIAVGIPSAERMTQQPTVRNRHRLVFRPPSVQETPAGRNFLHARYGIHRGISVIKRQNGTIFDTRYPALTDLEAASKYWIGGYAHTISVAEKDELTTAGFGAYITLEEVT